MIETLPPNTALDAVGHGKVLLCFARTEDVKLAERMLEIYSKAHSTRIVRVEPNVEAAEAFQLSRYPTFVLYDGGNERFQAVGTDALAEQIRKIIR